MKIRPIHEKWLIPACVALALSTQPDSARAQEAESTTRTHDDATDDRRASPTPAAPTPPSTDANSVFVLGTVSVQANRTGPLTSRDVLTSVDRVDARHLADRNVRGVWALFGQMPGVLLTDFNQGTTSGKLSFRGFNGEGEINAVKLLIDKIPSNSNDGNMPFMDAVFPLEITSLETVRGTNDPRYGLHNIAGTASLNTRKGGDYTIGRIGYGSDDTYSAEAVVGRESEVFSQNYAFGYRRSQGHRDHSGMDKSAIAGKWFVYPTDGVRLGASARYGRVAADEPGYLTQADSRSRPHASYAFNDTDRATRETGQYALYADIDLPHRLSWSTVAYLNTFRERRWITYSADVSQQERFSDERQVGFQSALTYRPRVPWLNAFSFEAGVSGEWQDNRSQRWLTVDRARESQTRNQAFTYNTLGTYVQAIIKPVDSLKLVPAYRVDFANGELTDHLSGKRYDMNDYGAIHQPKFSAVYTPIDGYSLYGNYGRTFQIGTGAGAYKIPPRTTDLAPSVNDGWEAGLKFRPAAWLDGRIAYWQQFATNEVRRKLNDPTGDFDNLGKTKRHGFDVQMNLRASRDVALWMAYTYQMARIVDAGPENPERAGKQVDHVPNHLLSAGLDYQAAPDLGVSVWANAQGAYFVEPTNQAGKFGAAFTANARIAYRLSKAATLDFQVTNLFNRYTEYVWYDGKQTLHSPGPGRAAFATLTLEY